MGAVVATDIIEDIIDNSQNQNQVVEEEPVTQPVTFGGGQFSGGGATGSFGDDTVVEVRKDDDYQAPVEDVRKDDDYQSQPVVEEREEVREPEPEREDVREDDSSSNDNSSSSSDDN